MPTREMLFWIAAVLAVLALLIWRAHPWTPAERARVLVLQGASMLADRPARAAALFRQAERISPNWQTEYLIASAYAAGKQYREALPYIRRSAKMRPDTEAYTLMGDIYAGLNDERQMRSAYSMAIILDPANATAANNMGYYYAQRGTSLGDAENLLLHAVELEPENGSFVDSLGWVYYRMGRGASAIRLLRRAAELEPGSAEIRYHLGAAYAHAGRLDDARVELQKALALQPNMPEARRELARING